MQIHKTTELKNVKVKSLIYGPPGSGKTSFAGSMGKRIKVLGLSAEAGLLSLQNIRDASGKTIPIDYVEIKKFEDMDEAFRLLRHGKHEYEGVFIDSLTEIQKSCKDFIMEKTKKDQMEMRDWGDLAMKIERMVRAFRDLPLHVTITALEETETDKATGEIRVMPALQGSVQKQLPAYFDEVLYAFAKEAGDGEERRIRHHLLTRNSGKYIGKDRSGKLPAVIVDPDWGKVFDLIIGKEGGTNAS